MEKATEYDNVLLSNASIEAIRAEYLKIVDEAETTKPDSGGVVRAPELGLASTDFGAEAWEYDTFEEFLAEFREPLQESILRLYHPHLKLALTQHGRLHPRSPHRLTIRIVFSQRAWIIRLSNFVDARASASTVPSAQTTPRIFIGHGGSPQWKDLKDHLHHQHGYEVEAYETGARAGHEIRDIITGMLDRSSFALLVMTGEDRQEDGALRARQNVIHELGLFQGRLGFQKALVLAEEGTETFSNINGVHQIRYTRSNIRETFGDVLATLKRECQRS